MDRKRHYVLILLFAILGCVVGYFMYDRMVLRKHEILQTRYTDTRFVSLMENLISGGIFNSENGRIVVNEQALAGRRLDKKTEERVRASVALLSAKDSSIIFERRQASIVNNLPTMDATIIRGSLVDRNGAILAKTFFNDKTNDQRREYPLGPAIYPLLGHTHPVFGKRGMEKVLDGFLTGQTHKPVFAVRPEPLKTIELGDNVTLTIESRLQKYAYEVMGEKKGAVVVLDVRTGEILAAVSTPSFDPATRDQTAWRLVEADKENRPWENRAFDALYPPGSTFKTVVASTWLDSGHGENSYQTYCKGSKNKYGISDIHRHGEVTLDSAFVKSCNVFFSEIGVQLGEEIKAKAEQFGFNKPINLFSQDNSINLTAETSLAFSWSEMEGEGKTHKLKSFNTIDFRRNPRIVAQGSIGQNLVVATPLQMAVVASTIANEGEATNPFMVKQIRTGDGKKIVFQGQPVSTGRPVTPATAQRLAKLMGDVMETGTGKNVSVVCFEEGKYVTKPRTSCKAPVRIAGKTGTAEVGDRNGNGVIDTDEKPHSWFIGFAPANHPRFAIAVIAENQGLGALTAAPIAAQVLAEAMNALPQAKK
jgi:peptidoglycan glycosyltransferase